MIAIIAISAGVLVALLTLVAYTSRLYTEAGRFLSREFQDNIEVFEQQIEPRIHISRQRATLSMSLLQQILIAAISLLIAFPIFSLPTRQPAEMAQLIVILLMVILIFYRFLPFVFFSRTRGLWLIHYVPILRVLIYLIMPLTLVLGFLQSVVALTKEYSDEAPEHPSEAVDALIEAGQDEGILEESDRELIHSVVEFGDKTAREVMTPRPEIFAVPSDTTVARFTELLHEQGYSRVPVYEGSIDKIIGIVLARDLLQVSDEDAKTKTVRELMRPDVYFVPETKLGSELLREMQRNNVRLAVVIDEYGGVAGLVTIEDLIEEIVGELRDEHDEVDQVVKEKDGSYIVPGSMDVDHLVELFDVRTPDDWNATTVAGLVSEIAGRIPQPGEVVEDLDQGLRFEVLQSTSRRIERLRISMSKTSQPQNTEPNQVER
jgi:putative hemolysin